MTADTDTRICVFGEVLFDHFPDGSRVLGGAPFNVAWHLQAMGQSPYFISRVGNDDPGEAVYDAMRRWGMQVDGLQRDTHLPTGQVQVSLLEGDPQYTIVENCAYDAIETPTLRQCGLLYHGSLAARSTRSAATLDYLRGIQPDRVFIDVNLRPPWWNRKQLLDLLRGAHWVKLNHDELCQLDESGAPERDRARHFIKLYDLEGVVVTHGAKGAEIVLADGERMAVAPQMDVQVVDTVGAGDAFSAVMIIGLVQQWPPALILQRAQEFAAAIVGRRGATVSDRGFYSGFLRDWGLRGPSEEN